MRIGPNLHDAIRQFWPQEDCQDPAYCHGCCDGVASLFLDHALMYGLEGTMLAVDNPHRVPTIGWKFWTGSDKDWREKPTVISHYMVYFPNLEIAVDFTARQFWHDAEVPMILTPDQVEAQWDQLPYGFDDSRQHEGN